MIRKLPNRRVLVSLVLFLWTSAPAFARGPWPDLSHPPKATGGGERDAAVIVGAQNYAFVEPVPGAQQNANDWQAYLTETLKVPVDRVSLLQSDDATLEQMRNAVARATAQVERGGTLWFIFIGHGAPSADGKDGLLVGIDAQQKAESVYSRSFSRNELLAALSKGKQSKTVVLLDACFSGKSTSGQELVAGLQPLITMRALPPGVDSRLILMTAAASDQFAGPLPGVARPAFSYLALGALRGWAADAKGIITASSLIAYARKTLSLSHDRQQTPELSTPATAHAVLGIGREPGPDLAGLQREAAAFSGGGFKTSAKDLPVAPATDPFFDRPSEAPKDIELRSHAESAPSDAEPFVAQAAHVTVGKAGIEWVKIPGGTFSRGHGAPFRVVERDNGPYDIYLNSDIDNPKPIAKSTISKVDAERILKALGAPYKVPGVWDVPEDAAKALTAGKLAFTATVKIKSFEMAKSLVTNKQYGACVAAGACTPAHVSDGSCWIWDAETHVATHGNLPSSFLGDDQPVVCVDWQQAKAFSAWVGGRLPSEAEWEYAARSAGKDWTYPWGNAELTCDRGKSGLPCAGSSYSTWPVCSKPKGNSEQGLCDMLGNASEWVEDWYHDSYFGAPTDGSAWEIPAGLGRVIRGAAWDSAFQETDFRDHAGAGFDSGDSIATRVRVAVRNLYDPGYRVDSVGFRPVR